MRVGDSLTGKCPASPALEGEVKERNKKQKAPYREAKPFRAWSFIPFCSLYVFSAPFLPAGPGPDRGRAGRCASAVRIKIGQE